MTDFSPLRDATSAPAGAARALPFSAYRDPEVFALEMERLYRGDWVAICPESLLDDEGDSLTLSIGGEPATVLRGSDGTLRALSNVCRHRGTPILDDGLAKGAKLVCPYHAWAYGDDGSFRGAPHTGNVEIDRAAHALPSFPLEVWQGVVFVNVDGKAEPLRDRLSHVDALFEAFQPTRYSVAHGGYHPEIWNANWKLAYENAVESYHVFKVHKETLEPAGPTRGAYYLEGNAFASATAGRYAFESQAYPIDPETIGDFERDHYVLVGIPPSFAAIITRETWGWIALHPEAPDRTRVVSNSLMPPAFARGEKERHQSDPATSAFLAEDQWICERGQKGMAARHSSGGQLVELERIVGDFHQYLGARLFGQTPEPTYREPRPAPPDDAPPPAMKPSRWRPILGIGIAALIILAIEAILAPSP